jgi:hypothetical protein
VSAELDAINLNAKREENLHWSKKRLATAKAKLRTAKASRSPRSIEKAQTDIDFHTHQIEWLTELLNPAPTTTAGAVSVRGRHAA